MSRAGGLGPSSHEEDEIRWTTFSPDGSDETARRMLSVLDVVQTVSTEDNGLIYLLY